MNIVILRLLSCGLAVFLALLATADFSEAAADAVEAVRRKCRLVAIGDLHGDVAQALKVLQLTKLTDDKGRWIGGCATLIQTGDIVDRGDRALDLLDLFTKLRIGANKQGGFVLNLLGNHENFLLQNDLRYVAESEIERKGGIEAFRNLISPRGSIGKLLRRRRQIVHFDEQSKTVFVHGGLTPEFIADQLSKIKASSSASPAHGFVDYINRVGRNALITDHEDSSQSQAIFGNEGPLWDREVVSAAMAGDCTRVEKSLQLLGANRMVVGHTPQSNGKIGSFCKASMIDIDVGISGAMSSGCAAIEIGLDGEVYAVYPGDERVKLA